MTTQINPKLTPSTIQTIISHALQNKNSLTITIGDKATSIVEHVFHGRDIPRQFQPVSSADAVLNFMQAHWVNHVAGGNHYPKWFAVLRVQLEGSELVKIVTSLERAETELAYWKNKGKTVVASVNSTDPSTGKAKLFQNTKGTFYRDQMPTK